jgi:DNA-directed RNA polymerase subunit omega
MARVSIEDCLDVLENRFALVTVAATRTRQLMNGDEPLVKSKNKFAVTALREIAEGLIMAQIPEELGEVTKAKLKPRHLDQNGNSAD